MLLLLTGYIPSGQPETPPEVLSGYIPARVAVDDEQALVLLIMLLLGVE